ncbi:hypothetical protein GN956_G18396 [Arapaima gigas]
MQELGNLGDREAWRQEHHGTGTQSKERLQDQGAEVLTNVITCQWVAGGTTPRGGHLNVYTYKTITQHVKLQNRFMNTPERKGVAIMPFSPKLLLGSSLGVSAQRSRKSREVCAIEAYLAIMGLEHIAAPES